MNETPEPTVTESMPAVARPEPGPTLSTRPLYRFAIVPNAPEQLVKLSRLAEDEDWNYRHTPHDHDLPILFNYLHHTFERLEDEGKIVVSRDGEHACFNTGLVTEHQEPIYALFDRNLFPDDPRPWHFRDFYRKGEHHLNYFESLPHMAHYFDDPTCLVFDTRLELRTNIEHVIAENRERFPEPYQSMSDYQLQTVVRGAIENAKERVQRNYKAAVPQHYRARVQLLLPLCLAEPSRADLALVAERFEGFYRASTCLTLDMAYNNARQLARPDTDWLQP
jgi:hypothetical protein